MISILFAFVAGHLAGATATIPAALTTAVEAYDKAQIKGDGGALRRLLADDYLLVNSGGQQENKAQFIADLTAPGYRLDPFVVQDPVLHAWRGGAVAGGVARLGGTEGGKPFSACLRFADVWSLRKGRWQVVFTQASHADLKACKTD